MTYDYGVSEVIRVVDGDTVDLRIDLGFHMSVTFRCRILGLRAREDNAGLPEKRYVESWTAANAGDLRVTTFKPLSPVTITPDASFGRWLGIVYKASNGASLRDVMVDYMWREYAVDVTDKAKR